MTLQTRDFLPEISVAEVVHDAAPAKAGLYRDRIKRWLDIALILVVLPALLPLMAVLMLVVARDGGHPIYRQERVGQGGRIFRIVKLRTMVVDADARLAEHLASDPAACAEWHERQKLFDDPRITPVGRLLRRTSLDELPQLWNVLMGEMSLVGPRPMMPQQRALYPGTAYYRLRPGITGFWQIAARNRSSFSARAHFDAAYERRVSFRADVAVLIRTVRVVLRCTGQ